MARSQTSRRCGDAPALRSGAHVARPRSRRNRHMEDTLFPLDAAPAPDAELEYYATPAWFAEILMERYFARLGPPT
jgi:hypothetical protein